MIEKYNLEEMIKGWFIGDFEPSLYKTNEVEVGVKHYKAGDKEELHHHKIATEFTVVIIGEVKMSGKYYSRGDIIKINPGITTDFLAITDVITVVVKLPGSKNDKYYK
jgi:mannose-6-phosphate isomerase-like protein (cupin superfamily)